MSKVLIGGTVEGSGTDGTVAAMRCASCGWIGRQGWCLGSPQCRTDEPSLAPSGYGIPNGETIARRTEPCTLIVVPSDLGQALLNVERAARGLDALFEGDPDGWRLGGRLIVNVDVSNALLSLNDYLNDVERLRGELPQ